MNCRIGNYDSHDFQIEIPVVSVFELMYNQKASKKFYLECEKHQETFGRGARQIPGYRDGK
jgi:hypothetical protein